MRRMPRMPLTPRTPRTPRALPASNLHRRCCTRCAALAASVRADQIDRMIAVAGFNSALDTMADTSAIRAGEVIRLSSVIAHPGGKGVHVAQTCGALGEAVRLVGLIDDGHQALFERVLAERAVTFRGVKMAGRLRTCYAIRDACGRITELLESSPPIEAETITQLERAFLNACEGASVAVLSGSLPSGAPLSLYAKLIARLHNRVAHVIVDTSGPALEEALAAGPTVVKPNRDEAARLIGGELSTMEDAMSAVREIACRGSRAAIVSLGADGAAVCWDGRLARIDVPVQTASDGAGAVGSGDCFVGGLAVALARSEPVDDALRLAAACGAANVLTREPGWCQRDDVERLMREVRIAWL
jgi:1-phosphofructokinase family hexose kinase